LTDEPTLISLPTTQVIEVAEIQTGVAQIEPIPAAP